MSVIQRGKATHLTARSSIRGERVTSRDLSLVVADLVQRGTDHDVAVVLRVFEGEAELRRLREEQIAELGVLQDHESETVLLCVLVLADEDAEEGVEGLDEGRGLLLRFCLDWSEGAALAPLGIQEEGRELTPAIEGKRDSLKMCQSTVCQGFQREERSRSYLLGFRSPAPQEGYR